MIFVNFKTYQEGTGKEAVKLAKICQTVEKKTSVKVIPLVQVVDLFPLSSQGFPVWSQHLDNIEEGQAILEARPGFLAYEPPEFIGNRTNSVASVKPEVIKDFTKAIKGIPVLVGAGIHSQQDVKTALELGAKGILVATDVVLAKKPEKELLDLAGGFK